MPVSSDEVSEAGRSLDAVVLGLSHAEGDVSCGKPELHEVAKGWWQVEQRDVVLATIPENAGRRR